MELTLVGFSKLIFVALMVSTFLSAIDLVSLESDPATGLHSNAP